MLKRLSYVKRKFRKNSKKYSVKKNYRKRSVKRKYRGGSKKGNGKDTEMLFGTRLERGERDFEGKTLKKSKRNTLRKTAIETVHSSLLTKTDYIKQKLLERVGYGNITIIEDDIDIKSYLKRHPDKNLDEIVEIFVDFHKRNYLSTKGATAGFFQPTSGFVPSFFPQKPNTTNWVFDNAKDVWEPSTEEAKRLHSESLIRAAHGK